MLIEGVFMSNDLIKGEILPEQLQAVLQAIHDIQTNLPFLIDLTTDERRSLPKMGDKSRAFVDQGLVLAAKRSVFHHVISIRKNTAGTWPGQSRLKSLENRS
jgi:hypothetical protein